MSDKEFRDELQQIRQALLRGGVAPRIVKRGIAELQDHHADIRDALIKEGQTPEQASAEAAVRVGDLQEIARDTLSRKELKSRISRWPKTTLLLGPALLFPATAVLVVLFIVALVSLFPQLETSIWFKGLTWSLTNFYMYVLPVVIAASLVILAQQRAIPPKLIICCILATAFLGTMIDIGVNFPDGPDDEGTVYGVLHFAGYAPGGRGYRMDLQFEAITRMAITTVLAFAFWRVLNRRIGLHAGG